MAIVRIKMKLLLLPLLLIFMNQLLAAEEWSFPAPKGAKVEWINNDSNVNGIKLKGRRFTSQDSVEEVLIFYRDLWGKEIAEIDYSNWKLLTHKKGKLLYTVQVKSSATGGSSGLLGVSDIAESLKVKNRKALAKNFPKLHGSEVINDMKMNDPGKQGQTVLLTNRLSIASNVQYYKDYYRNENWSLSVDKSIGFSAPHTLIFSKGKDRVNMVISRQGAKTNVVANVVNKKVLPW